MRNRFKKILKLISSKTFLGALAFSFALWLYINLNTEFVSFVKLPLYVSLPSNRAIEMALPRHVSVEVRGTGWQIFNLSYLNTAAKCEIDLSGESIIDSIYTINRSDLIKNLSDMGNVQAMDVVPNGFNLKTGRIGEYAVVVEPDVTIIPSDGYIVVGEIMPRPNLINIKGNDKKIKGINSWRTVPTLLEDVSEKIELIIPLSDTLNNIIKLSIYEVTIQADIQKLTEIKMKDVRVRLIGAGLPEVHKLMPLYMDVTVRGGIEEIENMNKEEIEINVNVTDIINDTTGLIKPLISLPQSIKLLKIDPPYLKHIKLLPKSSIAKK